MKTIFFLLTIFISFNLFAQQEIDTNYIYKPNANNLDTSIVSTDTLGSVTYKMDAAIVSILNKKVIVNESKPKIKGYRIQIFSVAGVNSTDKANKERAKFLMEYPDYQIYIVYNTPYFKVRIGDLRTKLEAYHLLQSILKDYPFAFVVVDEVNIPLQLGDGNKNNDGQM